MFQTMWLSYPIVEGGKKNGVHDCEDDKGEGAANQDELEH